MNRYNLICPLLHFISCLRNKCISINKTLTDYRKKPVLLSLNIRNQVSLFTQVPDK